MRIMFVQKFATLLFLIVASKQSVEANNEGFCKGKMTAEIQCDVNIENNWVPCNSARALDNCAVYESRLMYIMCNNMVGEIIEFIDDLTFAKYKGSFIDLNEQDFSGKQVNEPDGNNCRTKWKWSTNFDTCDTQFSAQMKLEGTLNNRLDEFGNPDYCYAYEFFSMRRLVTDPPATTPAPTKRLNIDYSTKSPTKLPTSENPTKSPTKLPTTETPTKLPTTNPTKTPTKLPTTKTPTKAPTTGKPTVTPCFNNPTFTFSAIKNGKIQKCDWITQHKDQTVVKDRKGNCVNKEVKAECGCSCAGFVPSPTTSPPSVSCENDPTFRFTAIKNGKSQKCDWITQHKDQTVVNDRKGNCVDKEVRTKCGCACAGYVPSPTVSPPSVSCENNPSFTFIAIKNGKSQKCDWITQHKDQTVVNDRKRNCIDMKVRAKCGCSCAGYVCENDPTFRFTAIKNGKSQKCDWITQHKDQTVVNDRKGNCVNNKVRVKCGCSCDGFVPSPTVSPPSVSCENDPTFTFIAIKNGKKQNCDWITQHKNKSVVKDRKGNCAHKNVNAACVCACAGENVGSCVNDQTFRFTAIKNGKIQKCDWIIENNNPKTVDLRKLNCRNKQVQTACGCSCGSVVNFPTAAPPTVICENDEKFRFTAIKNGKIQKCDWIMKHTNQATVDLRKNNCRNNDVKSACRFACDNC